MGCATRLRARACGNAWQRRAPDGESFQRNPDGSGRECRYRESQVRSGPDRSLEDGVAMSFVFGKRRSRGERRRSNFRRRRMILVRVMGGFPVRHGMAELPHRLDGACQEQKGKGGET